MNKVIQKEIQGAFSDLNTKIFEMYWNIIPHGIFG